MKKRVTMWLVAEKYAKLKIKLAILGTTFTAWLDRKISEEIEEKE